MYNLYQTVLILFTWQCSAYTRRPKLLTLLNCYIWKSLAQTNNIKCRKSIAKSDMPNRITFKLYPFNFRAVYPTRCWRSVMLLYVLSHGIETVSQIHTHNSFQSLFISPLWYKVFILCFDFRFVPPFVPLSDHQLLSQKLGFPTGFSFQQTLCFAGRNTHCTYDRSYDKRFLPLCDVITTVSLNQVVLSWCSVIHQQVLCA